MVPDVIRRLFASFGRPDTVVDSANDTARDARITDIEREQRKILARVEILERGGDPRGIRSRHD